jgi:hypothetical protein
VQRLKLIVQNRRFLLLTNKGQAPNLASQSLGAALRALPEQWQTRFGYRPLLAESFTNPEAYAGTCYKATNWEPVGWSAGNQPRCLATNLNSTVQTLSFTPAGRELVFQAESVVTVDVASGKQSAFFSTIEAGQRHLWGAEYCHSLSPDGAKLALTSPSNLEVDVWDARTGRRLYTLPGQHGTVWWPG